jgi:flagella basal body P-ring formation protein FlgA
MRPVRIGFRHCFHPYQHEAPRSNRSVEAIAWWNLLSRLSPAAGLLLCGLLSSSVFAQAIESMKPQPPMVQSSLGSIRLALKPKTECSRNIVELGDIADLSGSESILQSIRSLPLGPAPIQGRQQTWSREDVRYLLKLRGIDDLAVRWAGEEACQVVRLSTVPSPKNVEYLATDLPPQATTIAERTVSSVIAAYLKSKSSDAASWMIKPVIPPEDVKLLSQRSAIRGIAGGSEPWTGEQQFQLKVLTPQGEQAYRIHAVIQTPSMVLGAVGPLAKGHVISDSDLKLVRLTPVMKASEEDCYVDTAALIGKELRRSISTGQPILHADTGPVRTIQARDLVEIQVVVGALVAKTAGRALQSGGIDEVIEVEVVGSKKRLAARIAEGNVVEVIAR